MDKRVPVAHAEPNMEAGNAIEPAVQFGLKCPPLFLSAFKQRRPAADLLVVRDHFRRTTARNEFGKQPPGKELPKQPRQRNTDDLGIEKEIPQERAHRIQRCGATEVQEDYTDLSHAL